MKAVVITGAINCAKLQSPPTNQHSVFLQAGCPSCRPTNNVKALKGIISHSMGLLTPSSPGVFQLCLWPLIAPGYLGGGLPCLSSALWCQYPNLKETRHWKIINLPTSRITCCCSIVGSAKVIFQQYSPVISMKQLIYNKNSMFLNSHKCQWVFKGHYLISWSTICCRNGPLLKQGFETLLEWYHFEYLTET